MAEFEAPGVFVEEVSFRAKAIDGVPTSTLGMTGRTLTGPTEPVLITSRTEYEATFGALSAADGQPLYLAHAARAFFDNGGQRLWVTSAGTDVPPDADALKTGLGRLAEIDDIAIVACPDTVTLPAAEQIQAVQNLLDHCEALRYRFAIVDTPADSSLPDVQAFRSHFDSKHGALYYPWVVTPDTPPLALPPSGFVAGMLARTDLERGVHKAPTSEPVHGITGLALDVTQAQQEQLNPHGVNTLRTFAGRGIRLWGSRTLSADPEWQYVQIRRLFAYLEHSIDKGTQWAVFEPNNEKLWASVRQVIEDFLLSTWQSGAILGSKPGEAFFVKCDRTTMTQNDLDNGRLVCLVGVAPIKPAEFVIFRIGQRTADAT